MDMSESEIRRVIEAVCAELDRKARRVVFPAVMGAGIFIGGCGDDDGIKHPRDMSPVYGVDIGVLDTRPADRGKVIDGFIPRDAAIYGVPDVRIMDAAEIDKGPQIEYMAPDPDGGKKK